MLATVTPRFEVIQTEKPTNVNFPLSGVATKLLAKGTLVAKQSLK